MEKREGRGDVKAGQIHLQGEESGKKMRGEWKGVVVWGNLRPP